MKRITEEVSTDWRAGFGSLSEEEGERLEEIVSAQRKATNEGLAVRQQRALDAMTDETEE